MLKKMACIGVVLILIVSLTGCNKENKINEYDKENNIQVLESKELIRDADYSEGNIVVPYIDINNSEINEINEFLHNKAEELKKYEFVEGNGKKQYIHSIRYSYYLDKKILSLLVVEHSSEGDGYDWYYSYNIDLESNKVLTTKDVISKIIDSEGRKKIDEKFLEELNKYLGNFEFDEYYYDYCKDEAVDKYIVALESFDVGIYVNESKNFEIIIPLELPLQHYDFIFDTAIDLDVLFNSNEKNLKSENIQILKGKVLDFSMSDYKPVIINYDAPDFVDVSDNTDYYTLIEKAYYCDIFPDNIWDLYGKYLPHISVGDGMTYSKELYVATSTLDDGKYNYDVTNLANELDEDNSWVEGKKGYGIGEKITVYMTSLNELCRGNILDGYKEEYVEDSNLQYNANFNGIYIVNGYAQSEALYKANSRVKKLKLTINDKEEYILELEDTMKPQVFDINYKASPSERLYPIKAEFEILEVYKGTKYEDTAINTLRFGYDADLKHRGR